MRLVKLKRGKGALKKLDQSGLIPLLLAVLFIVVSLVLFAYLRVQNAK